MLYELNTSGKYYAFKEQLKRAIVKIVREKYLHTAPIADPVQRQAFLSNLYVFLTEQMHKTYVLPVVEYSICRAVDISTGVTHSYLLAYSLF